VGFKNLGENCRSLIDINLTFVLRNLEKPCKSRIDYPFTLPEIESKREWYNFCGGHPVVF
jgi:hypothetical protein